MVLKPPEMLQALMLGSIDAFIAWEPYPSQSKINGTGRIIISSEKIWKKHPCCVLVADAGFCAENPDKVRQIKEVHKLSCSFIKDNLQESIEIGMKYTGMDKQAVSMAVSNIIYSPEADKKKADVFIEYLKELKYIRDDAKEITLSNIFYE